jgi:hypothetical protein
MTSATSAAAVTGGAFREAFIIVLLLVGMVFVCMLLCKWAWDYGRWKWNHYIEQQTSTALAAAAHTPMPAAAVAARLGRDRK